MDEGAPALENKDAAESDRLSGLSRRLSAVESRLGDSSTSANKQKPATSLVWLLVPVLLVVAVVGALFAYTRKPQEAAK